MELRELQFFVVSVDAGSLSQAAQILYTTQPHVSKTIKKLERITFRFFDYEKTQKNNLSIKILLSKQKLD